MREEEALTALEKAREFGRQAFGKGIPAPILDTEFWSAFGNNPGADAMKAWIAGATEARLAAPIEEDVV